MYRGTTRVSEKCIACYPRVEGKDPLTGGEPMETRCMAACVGKIRLQGLNKIGEDGLWAEDRWHPLYYTIRVEQVALPLYPQWGTEPNGFYIPPRRPPQASGWAIGSAEGEVLARGPRPSCFLATNPWIQLRINGRGARTN